jgi:hypothetical protein
MSTAYAFATPPGERFSVDWRVLREPPLPQQFYYHTSFWVDAPGGWASGSGGRGGYFGLQRIYASGLRKVIFSLWDDTVRPGVGEATPIPLHAEDVRTPADGGWGAHTGMAYPWKVGTPYRFTLQHIAPQALWLCVITNLATNAHMPVGLIRAEGTLAGWCMSHFETLSGSQDCAGHGPAVVVWENWQPAVKVQMPYWDGTCPDVLTRSQIGDVSTAYVLR